MAFRQWRSQALMFGLGWDRGRRTHVLSCPDRSVLLRLLLRVGSSNGDSHLHNLFLLDVETFGALGCHLESLCSSVSERFLGAEGSAGLGIFFQMVWGKAKITDEMLVCEGKFSAAPKTKVELGPVHEASMRSARPGPSWAWAPQRAKKMFDPTVPKCRWKVERDRNNTDEN
ncbi:hypothetical protein NDU88_006163 [Pleurodeles waltl]|uniref:Uncharacterized protein n=1 Tax=Pleurodeles waltl TaxID=8319 RepID=A0AAV7LPZ6_PLEWA|nr:hypothetical protein NDU88_006163 [Pleurodeles waltl]